MMTEMQDEIQLEQMRRRQKHTTIQTVKQVIESEIPIWKRIQARPVSRERVAFDEAKARQAKEQEINQRLIAAGISPRGRFCNASFANYQTPTRDHAVALAACREAVKGFPNGDGVLLLGDPGGGKTHLLIAMIRAYIEQGKKGKLVTMEDYFIGLRECMGSTVSESRYVSSFATVDILAIDDIYCVASSKERHDESYQYRMLWYLLNKRYEAKLPTLASTNKSLSEFREMIDERTRRRLEAKAVVVPRRKN